MIEELDKEIAMRLKPYQQQLKFRPPEVGEFRMSRCEAKKSLSLQELRWASVIPLLASGQGGVAERSIKCREASADREAGVVFRWIRKGKPPRLRRLRWLRDIYFDDAASPPCGDARRGITLAQRRSLRGDLAAQSDFLFCYKSSAQVRISEIGVHRTRNSAEFSRQHPGRNGNGHESGGAVSRMPSLGIVGDGLSRQQ